MTVEPLLVGIRNHFGN